MSQIKLTEFYNSEEIESILRQFLNLISLLNAANTKSDEEKLKMMNHLAEYAAGCYGAIKTGAEKDV